MTADEAVAECRMAFDHDRTMWPKSLVEYLDQPDNEDRVFAWIVRCTRRLLQALGECDPKLEEQLQLFEHYVRGKTDPATIRETVEQLWVQRSWTQTARTAVVQLFGALAYYRDGEPHRHAACTVSIRMLVREAPNPRELMDLVLIDFNQFVAECGNTPEPIAVQQLWLQEANRRLEEVRSGRAETFPGEDVLAEGRQLAQE